MGRPAWYGQCGEALGTARKLGHLLDLLARQAVDDAGIALARGEEGQQLLARLILGLDAVEDVRPVELERKRSASCRCRRWAISSRVRMSAVAVRAMRGTPREQLGELAQLQVLRAEVMAPLRHAVRLVDGEQRQLLQALQEIQHARLHQALGRQVEELDLAAADALGNAALLLGAQGGVERHRGHAEFVEGGDLVVHQRDQRRDDHRQPLAQQTRHLIAQRLAAAGGHQYQGIATTGHAIDDRRLVAAEGVVTEDIFENAQRGGHGRRDHPESEETAAQYTRAWQTAGHRLSAVLLPAQAARIPKHYSLKVVPRCPSPSNCPACKPSSMPMTCMRKRWTTWPPMAT